MYTALALTPATDRYVETAFTLAPHQVVILEDTKADALLNDFPEWFDVVEMDCETVLNEGLVYVGTPFAYPVEVVEEKVPAPEVSPAAEEGEIAEPTSDENLLENLLDNASDEAVDTAPTTDQEPVETPTE